MKNKIGVVFDLDGTLLNTLEDLKDSVNYVLKKNNFPTKTLQEIKSFVGNGVRVLMERALPNNLSKEDFELYYNEFKEYYSIHLQDKTKPYDGILELLAQLKKSGVKIAVVSNKFQSAVEELNRIYFHNYIEVAIGNQEGINSKPAPDSVYLAIKRLHLELHEDIIYFVGDSEVDIQTAHNANIPVISVTWGFKDKEFLETFHPDFIATNVEELKNIILN